jgi:hypothetical protein
MTKRQEVEVSQPLERVAFATSMRIEITRRELLLQAMALGALAAVAAQPLAVGAQTPEASPVSSDDLAALVNLSRTLTGGKVDEARAAMLLDFLRADPDLSKGFDQLLADPPVADQRVAQGSPAAVAAVILTFWYAGSLDGQPVADRDTAYYQLTAWQAMYTFPGSVCRGFGAWQDEPAATPIVPAT